MARKGALERAGLVCRAHRYNHFHAPYSDDVTNLERPGDQEQCHSRGLQRRKGRHSKPSGLDFTFARAWFSPAAIVKGTRPSISKFANALVWQPRSLQELIPSTSNPLGLRLTLAFEVIGYNWIPARKLEDLKEIYRYIIYFSSVFVNAWVLTQRRKTRLRHPPTQPSLWIVTLLQTVHIYRIVNENWFNRFFSESQED